MILKRRVFVNEHAFEKVERHGPPGSLTDYF